ncbi:dual specificity protein phosphatase 16-like [Oncorhynchus kisutch]|uniref:protein-tyrosine-phosphatase n=1 Tax=Oncorhynchus kisutch TaxID=8019 RepID=A0A8C7HSP7_ONCKI|nr:dual specificity protein phosphatase 16-like [Oncorhynchus kisutch]
MVFYRERENGTRERPPLSLILPHLYLGAETDVTQDCLDARGISYVLSVSCFSPQPTFLPRSQYLRIPIEDSLRDDLLPHIPEALRFIDGAMSSGGSVVVHCAAGISRSPALAVAYIMYNLGMDLDHAYRFVKERRPSISPNFNFLGQLQHFQGTLTQKTSNGNPTIQPIRSLDTCLQPSNENISSDSSVPLSANQIMNIQVNGYVAKDFLEVAKVHNMYNENSTCNTENIEQRSSYSGETQSLSEKPQQDQRSVPSQLTLSLARKHKTLTLNLNHNRNQREAQSQCGAMTPSPNEPATPTPKSNTPQIPTGIASHSEKRKSLTLSLSLIGAIPPTPHQNEPESSNRHSISHKPTQSSVSNNIHKRESEGTSGSKRHGRKPSTMALSSSQTDVQQRERSTSCVKAAGWPNRSSSQTQTQAKVEREGRGQPKREPSRCQSVKKGRPKLTPKTGKDHSKGRAERETLTGSLSSSSVLSQDSIVVDQQVSPAAKLSASAVRAEERVDAEQSLLFPLNLTVNKLLGWGEKMLLGVLFGPRIKMEPAILPYRC